MKEIAIALRPYRQIEKYFHVAFIVNKSAIRAIGWNDSRKTHPMVLNFPYKTHSRIHAEMSAFLKLKGQGQSAKGMTIVVLRLDSSNGLRNSKPCVGCEALIREAGFSKVWYSGNDQKFHMYRI